MVRDHSYTLDAEEKMIIFSVDTKRHIRAAYYDGDIWYAVMDIAKLLRYSAPGKVAERLGCEYKLLRVPHTSINVRGYTNCNCIRQGEVRRLVNSTKIDTDIREWILRTVIPQAEQQFMAPKPPAIIPVEPARVAPPPPSPQAASLADMLDQFIISAVTLRQALRA